MSEDNVQVSVQWKRSTVFASETVDCTITFTNATNTRLRRSPSPGLRINGKHRDRWKEPLPIHTRNHSAVSTHRSSPSLDPTSSNNRPLKTALGANAPNETLAQVRHSHRNGSGSTQLTSGKRPHRRSISIVSIGGDGPEGSPARGAQSRNRPNPNHVRAASMQILPRRNAVPGPASALAGGHDRASTLPSPFFNSSASLAETGLPSQQNPRAGLKRFASSTASPKTDANQLAGFRFPSAPKDIEGLVHGKPLKAPKISDPLRRALSPQPSTQNIEQASTLTKILSPGSVNHTPRSSGEFFSMSNNSTETLASEYPAQETSRMIPQPIHRRKGSSLGPLRIPKAITIMMAYAQIIGSFTLDGSLVNQSAFEEVKRKAIVGGQGGGGLVRSQSVKRDSGLLSSFGWGNLGETFGGLLGDTGMSSIKEAKKSTSTKAIPVLSAPQSILFVDLQLAPGQSRAFHFSHPIPRGCPPSYKGRVIKIQYSLIIGRQQAAKIGMQNQVQRVEIPFRVLPCVNGDGDVLGHDLMSPHTLLSDSAKVSSIDGPQLRDKDAGRSASRSVASYAHEFSLYANRLLEQASQQDSGGLLSPTEDEPKSLVHGDGQQLSMKDIIDIAVLRGNSGSSKRNVNRFEINRGGEKVAVIMLSRPAYRLGETIPIIIDFDQADIACYSVHATLESTESVDPSIALRSKASIQRVTRRIHVSHHENTVSSDRVVFNPMVPITATPEFITSGVSLEWNLRVEFVTNRSGLEDEFDEDLDGMLEEIANDDRGSVKAAIQGLPCEMFDVAVPLRIYGATAAVDENADSGVVT